ncbi:small acid-soluble spore protein P [Brevibacillus choshinensis]|uniref:small acid-soluble spore protein P n=1 Tax=Brevibacillus choshinensis TaxID=54911 RepID=UPI002E223432|nr:small acid-soluble spore protein P [Brevibacillus choshinensis]MED4582189.1 small acid-soluble spore protein P [Brevibacillus choshinensis]MED4750257.1 small acid-soluble spore protein P [Brevibacillus choshinensis]MED4780844.1 small acid-soluble spore protein P [Brevibacillus choshinensis]
MEKDHRVTDENPHQTYNNEARGLEQTGEPLPGSKKVKQQNHSRSIKTREG